MQKRLDHICQEAAKCAQKGFSIIILSDRNVSADRIPIRLVISLELWYIYEGQLQARID